MTETTRTTENTTLAILDQLNRDIVALRQKHRVLAEEAYPGQRGEIDMPLDDYDARMAECDRELAITDAIEVARSYVLEARERAARGETS